MSRFLAGFFPFVKWQIDASGIISSIFLCAALVSISNKALSQRPNFVIIIIDDAHEASLPPNGPSFLDYPSIQRIYDQGLRVCDAYCLQPFCNPSRYSMYTGMYPHVHGAIDDKTFPRADLPTFFTITANAGYHNAFVGKYSNVEKKNIAGFERELTLKTIDQYNPSMFYNGIKDSITGNTTVIINDTTEAWLAVIDTPFIFGVGHIGTHTPPSIVNAYENTYNGSGVMPDNFIQYTTDFPSFLYLDPFSFTTDSDQVKKRKEELYEVMQEIDRGVGNIFSVLESRGILDNTMIIFVNDNGFLYGEHQLWGKQDAREPSSGVPLFIRYPEWFTAGTVACNNMVGLHDLYPTILEAAGINTSPYHFQGQSLHSLLQPGQERTSIYLESLHTYADSISPSWRAVRSGGFKYVRYRCESAVEELFDLTMDEDENANQVNNPAYSDTLNVLRFLLDSLSIVTMDTFSADSFKVPCALISCEQFAFYRDADHDGFGNSDSSIMACIVPAGYTSDSTDCNDSPANGGAAIHPGASEICNNKDDDCDGTPDDGLTFNMYYTDADGDHHGDLYDSGNLWCTNPGAGYFTNHNDCNDANAAVHPGAMEICNGLDDNCNIVIDEGLTFINYYADADGDYFGDISASGNLLCSNPGAGFCTNQFDCNDNDAAIHPGAIETCNNIDDNCDGNNDEGLILNTYYIDADGDDYGNESIIKDSCAQPVGYVIDNTDCNDAEASVYPGAAEIMNNEIDDDCDGYTDEFGTSIHSTGESSFLLSVYPNPTQDLAYIYFTLQHASYVSVKVYDLTGKEMAYNPVRDQTHLNDEMHQGGHSLLLYTSSFAKGAYIVRLITNAGVENVKLMVQ